MHESLIRGFSKQALQERPNIEEFFSFLNTPRCRVLWSKWKKVCRSKKIDRAQMRFLNGFPDIFFNARFVSWKKDWKVMLAHNFFWSEWTPIIDETRKGKSYREPAIVSGMVFYSANQLSCGMSAEFTSSISHHTISRMFERDLMTGTTYRDTLELILNTADLVHTIVDQSEELSGEPRNFPIPFKDGALIMRSCKMRGMDFDPETEKWGPGDPTPIISVRTWLSPEMIGRRLANQMGALPDAGEEREFADTISEEELLRISYGYACKESREEAAA